MPLVQYSILKKTQQSKPDKPISRLPIYLNISRLREEAKELINSSTTKANRTQTDVTEKLGERIQGINYWKFELERGIQDMTSKGSFAIRDETM